MECNKSTVRSRLRRQKIYSNKNAHELLKKKESERKNGANKLAPTLRESDEDAKVEYRKNQAEAKWAYQVKKVAEMKSTETEFTTV